MSQYVHITGCQYARMNLTAFRSLVEETCTLQSLNMIKRQIDSLEDRIDTFPDIEQRRQLVADRWQHIHKNQLVISMPH